MASYPKPEEVLLSDLLQLFNEPDAKPAWRKPWTATAQSQHKNLVTSAEYSGANPLVLELYAALRGHTTPLWLGSGQAKKIGCFPKKGSKAARILRPQLNQYEKTDDSGQLIKDAEGNAEINAWVSYKVTCVFNVSDLQGKDEKAQAALEARIKEAMGEQPRRDLQEILPAAESVLRAWSVRTQFGGSRACYSPSGDVISMPDRETFQSLDSFYATWAHEQAHSTGHKSRLNRDMGGKFGSKSYAREELVAELASVLIGCRLGIGCDLQNHVAYLHSWADNLKEGGPKALIKALTDARKAADLITGVSTTEDPVKPSQELVAA